MALNKSTHLWKCEKKQNFKTKFIAHNGATNTKKVRKEIMHKLWTFSGIMRIYFYEIIFYYGKKGLDFCSKMSNIQQISDNQERLIAICMVKFTKNHPLGKTQRMTDT